jgi:hypothetical protein
MERVETRRFDVRNMIPRRKKDFAAKIITQ